MPVRSFLLLILFSLGLHSSLFSMSLACHPANLQPMRVYRCKKRVRDGRVSLFSRHREGTRTHRENAEWMDKEYQVMRDNKKNYSHWWPFYIFVQNLRAPHDTHDTHDTHDDTNTLQLYPLLWCGCRGAWRDGESKMSPSIVSLNYLLQLPSLLDT